MLLDQRPYLVRDSRNFSRCGAGAEEDEADEAA